MNLGFEDFPSDVDNPLIESLFAQYNRLSYKKFVEYQLVNQDLNIKEYNIIVINNSSTANGLNIFIKNQMAFVKKYVKIYLYKKDELQFIIGPIKIDYLEKITFITNFIVNFLKRDEFVESKKDIENNIKATFNDRFDTNKVHMFIDD